MSSHEDHRDATGSGDPAGPLLDFPALAQRMTRVVPVLVALTVLGAVAEVVTAGASAALVVRWGTIFVVLVLAAMAVLTAVHALGGADRAQRRGERLAGDDVRLTPPPRRSWPDRAAPDGD